MQNQTIKQVKANIKKTEAEEENIRMQKQIAERQSHATYHATMSGANLQQAQAGLLTFGPVGGPSVAMQQARANLSRTQIENLLTTAGLPAAKIRGTKTAELWRTYGQSIMQMLSGIAAAASIRR